MKILIIIGLICSFQSICNQLIRSNEIIINNYLLESSINQKNNYYNHNKTLLTKRKIINKRKKLLTKRKILKIYNDLFNKKHRNKLLSKTIYIYNNIFNGFQDHDLSKNTINKINFLYTFSLIKEIFMVLVIFYGTHFFIKDNNCKNHHHTSNYIPLKYEESHGEKKKKKKKVSFYPITKKKKKVSFYPITINYNDDHNNLGIINDVTQPGIFYNLKKIYPKESYYKR